MAVAIAAKAISEDIFIPLYKLQDQLFTAEGLNPVVSAKPSTRHRSAPYRPVWVKLWQTLLMTNGSSVGQPVERDTRAAPIKKGPAVPSLRRSTALIDA